MHIYSTALVLIAHLSLTLKSALLTRLANRVVRRMVGLENDEN
jgi:hypothetical protein